MLLHLVSAASFDLCFVTKVRQAGWQSENQVLAILKNSFFGFL